ncbi:Uncharacterized conserved protein YbjT, contains NAD(P)-binding and DUF2867 domains [Chitinophaga sp. CF118]|uniref:NAD(P)H-binding protein n=1 Tax=Chitinophaga sp. CF118 TaxID=1884367 RepID=UPI0008EB5B12|nr:NAD(P)H-binding protein [Chitinophaga sp. CF118]SFF02732.1 Uncharacterized conserved protein YbjT, contains NAD(P)-binding and DUF2867 domains [Chitinophaga sp. CF118]
MKITLTGSIGNISKPLAKLLISNGHQVTIISSNQDKTAEIEALGAKAVIGSITDVAFLTTAFSGADVVYTMIPPNFGVTGSYREYMGSIGKNYAEAIRKSGVKRVVNLSSMGARKALEIETFAGAYDVENILNALEGVSVKQICAPYFYFNFYNNIGMIKNQGFLGANYASNTRMLMVHPEDISTAIAEEIQQPFNGNSVRYVVSDERTPGEVATILGTAIGKPELPWIQFSDEQALGGMMQGGIPEGIASIFIKTGTMLSSGKLWEDYDLNKPSIAGTRKLESFAKEFAARF